MASPVTWSGSLDIEYRGDNEVVAADVMADIVHMLDHLHEIHNHNNRIRTWLTHPNAPDDINVLRICENDRIPGVWKMWEMYPSYYVEMYSDDLERALKFLVFDILEPHGFVVGGDLAWSYEDLLGGLRVMHFEKLEGGWMHHIVDTNVPEPHEWPMVEHGSRGYRPDHTFYTMIDRPIRRTDLIEDERKEMMQTHHWFADPDGQLDCTRCAAKPWHAAALYECGTEPPREIVWVEQEQET